MYVFICLEARTIFVILPQYVFDYILIKVRKYTFTYRFITYVTT